MNDILIRIRKVFDESGKSQTEIGKKISKTPQYVWKLLNNDTITPRDSVIKDICRAFGVNEDWVRYGIGPMYKERDGSFTELLSELDDSDDDFIKSLVMVYMGLDEDSKEALRKIAKGMAEKYKKLD